jgi:DNA-binding MarR family transcriptional regulator
MDRRVIHAVITPAGLEVWDRSMPVLMSALDEHFERHLDEEDMAVLRALLSKILKGNGAWEAVRCSPELEGATPARAGERSAP